MNCNKCKDIAKYGIPNIFTCYMVNDNTLTKECLKLFYEGVGVKNG